VTTSRQLFVQDPTTGRIRFTRAGVERYRTRFARVGFDITSIRTLAQFEAAVDASFAREMRELAATARGEDRQLDEALKGLSGWE
jgi:hypothetical protein